MAGGIYWLHPTPMRVQFERSRVCTALVFRSFSVRILDFLSFPPLSSCRSYDNSVCMGFIQTVLHRGMMWFFHSSFLVPSRARSTFLDLAYPDHQLMHHYSISDINASVLVVGFISDFQFVGRNTRWSWKSFRVAVVCGIAFSGFYSQAVI